eukprot:2429640-Alexandrium_andersonii.AAC.1
MMAIMAQRHNWLAQPCTHPIVDVNDVRTPQPECPSPLSAFGPAPERFGVSTPTLRNLRASCPQPRHAYTGAD